MTFKQYLAQQVDRSDLVGDFARDAVADPTFPQSGDREAYEEYLPDHDFIRGIFAAVWNSYEAHVSDAAGKAA
jgi:hypothetical protein